MSSFCQDGPNSGAVQPPGDASNTMHSKLRPIHLEWATGCTLREWIRSNLQTSPSRPVPQHTLSHVLCLARDITGALADMHEAGVFHNNLSLDNILVHTHPVAKKDGGDNEGNGQVKFSIKIIDHGAACLLDDKDSSALLRAQRQDLVSLGSVLYKLFSGRSPSDHVVVNESQHDCAMDEVGTSRCPPHLSGLCESQYPYKVPVSVSTLVSTLLDWHSTANNSSYHCARDVELDLLQMLDYPDRFFVNFDREQVLDFPQGRLYGRHAEVTKIFGAYSRVATAGGRSEMVLVKGISGSGKSSLVGHFRQSLDKNGGSFLSGKFDSLQHVEPLSAIRAAFRDYFKTLVDDDWAKFDSVRSAIRDKLGSDGISALVDLIPSLRQVVEDEVAPASVMVSNKGAQSRLKHLFRLFAMTTASALRPLVLFLDDLQWADAASLDIIETLVTDGANEFLFFIGCYRDNEVGGAHPLSVWVRDIEKQGVPITKIDVGSISKDSMNHMISDALYAPRSSTRSLTDAVYFKTKGNAFDAIQFVTSLYDQGFLALSASGLWQWDAGRIQSDNSVATSLQLVTDKLLGLPPEIRGALEVAACLGSRSEEATLCLISDEDIGMEIKYNGGGGGSGKANADENLAKLLDVAVSQGFMNKVGSRYEFVHDLIQHAVYKQIARSKKDALHLQIGKRIWKRSTLSTFEENMFLAVDQIYLGMMFIEPDEDIDIAQLFVRAGKKAMLLALFPSAATYFDAGIRILRPGHWDDNYGLSLQLYASFAETGYCNGQFERMGEVVDEIFAHARCFEDQLAAYGTLVKALGAMGKLQKAIQIGLFVLEQLGEVFPESDENSSLYLRELDATRDMLDEYTDETLITEMNVMEDEKKIAVMEFLNHLVVYTHLERTDISPLISLRMLQLSLKYGVCKESAFAFASYGGVLCQFGELKRGYEFGQLALKLLDRFDGKDCLAVVYTSVYSKQNFWCEHFKLSLRPLLHGYQMGMNFGDVQHAMYNARIFCLISFQCGNQLANLENQVLVFCDAMRKHKQERVLALMVILKQTLLNLMGRSCDPLKLSGEAMDQDQLLNDAKKTNNTAVVWFIHLHCMWLACIFGDYRLAGEHAEGIRLQFKSRTSGFAVCSYVFYDGLTSLVLAREANKSQCKLVGDKALGKLKRWADLAPCNFKHKALLLEAELAFLLEDFGKAEKAYSEAIAGAGENGFIHEQAIACERAAAFHSENGNKSRAVRYFAEARSLYLQWGASCKADQLRQQLVALSASCTK